eukprot:gnl/TRDRNA2_/TRDRNA2_165544_c0_seq1.p1 gnl/TRDRNA2_/TRDRNA2_165544_c0~~gnl/TRDRNA2_/TRDRNA2_165544_c0_seq1.p1  ORF type:complete len:433 (+),score=53.21 gnl/TRDRNA2_/TRDRNA2_165544_c0_seq1:40-1338(+)
MRAIRLIPALGSPFDTDAVMRLHEGRYFDSLVLLLRALGVARPFVQAAQNLAQLNRYVATTETVTEGIGTSSTDMLELMAVRTFACLGMQPEQRAQRLSSTMCEVRSLKCSVQSLCRSLDNAFAADRVEPQFAVRLIVVCVFMISVDTCDGSRDASEESVPCHRPSARKWRPLVPLSLPPHLAAELQAAACVVAGTVVTGCAHAVSSSGSLAAANGACLLLEALYVIFSWLAEAPLVTIHAAVQSVMVRAATVLRHKAAAGPGLWDAGTSLSIERDLCGYLGLFEGGYRLPDGDFSTSEEWSSTLLCRLLRAASQAGLLVESPSAEAPLMHMAAGIGGGMDADDLATVRDTDESQVTGSLSATEADTESDTATDCESMEATEQAATLSFAKCDATEPVTSTGQGELALSGRAETSSSSRRRNSKSSWAYTGV